MITVNWLNVQGPPYAEVILLRSVKPANAASSKDEGRATKFVSLLSKNL